MSIWKRSISLMLAVLMCFSLVSPSFATVFADENDGLDNSRSAMQLDKIENK